MEISEALIKEKFVVTLLCGFKKEKYIPKDYQLRIRYFNSIDIAGLFRYSLMANILFWLVRRIRQGDIVIFSPGALCVGFLLKLIKKCNVHLDVRTVPVEIHNLRDRIDHLLFWTMPFKVFKRVPRSFSFIASISPINIVSIYISDAPLSFVTDNDII